MNNFNHLNCIYEISKILEGTEYTDISKKIKDCINFSSTGTEIIMCCRHSLLDLQKSAKLSNDKILQEKVCIYLDETEKLLK